MTDELRERAKKLHKRYEELLNMPVTCPKCHGNGTYKLPIYDDMRGIFDTDYWQDNDCELCHGTGKITLQFYEELQRKCRKNERD